jgi:PhnB protein
MTDTGMPSRTGGVTPHLVVDGAAAAIDFYRRAFDAEEMMRLTGPDGRMMHAAVRINGAMVMLADVYPEMGDTSPKALGGTPVTLHCPVPDADAAVARAAEAGATVVMPVELMFWGDRYGLVEDPFGHRWAFATPVAPKFGAELEAAAREAMETSHGA